MLWGDLKRLGQAWLRALSAATAFTAPIAVGMAVAAPALIDVMFGRRWLGMVTVLELLALAALPQPLTTTAAGLLRATGATTTLFRLGLVTSSGTLIAIGIGLPWGTVGVASALLVKFCLEVIISMRPCLRQTKLTAGDLMRAMRGVWLSCLFSQQQDWRYGSPCATGCRPGRCCSLSCWLVAARTWARCWSLTDRWCCSRRHTRSGTDQSSKY